jgi:DNA-binding response OmpR family regulator
LLIADIALRGANGLELQRALRVQRPALRAVFLSRYPHAVALEDEARSAGESVLREPFDIQSLLARVEEALHGQARKPPERAVESAASKPAAQLRR